MSFAPTNAASAATDRGAFAARFGWLMFGIERLGMKLTRLLSRDVPETGGTADQCEAWLLVSRSVRWLHALQARLARGDAAETAPVKAAPADAPDVVRADVVKAPDSAGTRAGKAVPPRRRTADDEIRGKSTEAVVARICADLGTAAGLLGDAQAARRAAQLAEEARALLNGEPEPAINPRSPEYDVVAWDPDAAMPARALAAGLLAAPGAPDTG